MAGPSEDFAHANGQPAGVTLSTSSGTILATSASTNQYGAWTQIIASTTYDITHLLLSYTNFNTQGFGFVIDIGAGPSGSETPIISELLFASTGVKGGSLTIPVGPLKAGTRLAGRAASSSASDTPVLPFIGLDCGFKTGPMGSGQYDTFGWAGAGSTIAGIQIDPGAVANTKGAWTQIVASTPHDLIGFFLGFDCLQFVGGGTSVAAPQLVDIGLGAAGSEVVILPDVFVFSNPENFAWEVSPSFSGFVNMPIKAGTRIAARSQSSNTADRTFGLSFYGLRA